MARPRAKLRLIQDPSRKSGKKKPAELVPAGPKVPPGLSDEEAEEFRRLSAQYPGCTSSDMLAETAKIVVDLRRLAECIREYGILLDTAKVRKSAVSPDGHTEDASEPTGLKLNPAVRMQQTGRDQLRKMLVYLEGTTIATGEASADEVPAIG